MRKLSTIGNEEKFNSKLIEISAESQPNFNKSSEMSHSSSSIRIILPNTTIITSESTCRTDIRRRTSDLFSWEHKSTSLGGNIANGHNETGAGIDDAAKDNGIVKGKGKKGKKDKKGSKAIKVTDPSAIGQLSRRARVTFGENVDRKIERASIIPTSFVLESLIEIDNSDFQSNFNTNGKVHQFFDSLLSGSPPDVSEFPLSGNGFGIGSENDNVKVQVKTLWERRGEHALDHVPLQTNPDGKKLVISDPWSGDNIQWIPFAIPSQPWKQGKGLFIANPALDDDNLDNSDFYDRSTCVSPVPSFTISQTESLNVDRNRFSVQSNPQSLADSETDFERVDSKMDVATKSSSNRMEESGIPPSLTLDQELTHNQASECPEIQESEKCQEFLKRAKTMYAFLENDPTVVPKVNLLYRGLSSFPKRSSSLNGTLTSSGKGFDLGMELDMSFYEPRKGEWRDHGGEEDSFIDEKKRRKSRTNSYLSLFSLSSFSSTSLSALENPKNGSPRYLRVFDPCVSAAMLFLEQDEVEHIRREGALHNRPRTPPASFVIPKRSSTSSVSRWPDIPRSNSISLKEKLVEIVKKRVTVNASKPVVSKTRFLIWTSDDDDDDENKPENDIFEGEVWRGYEDFLEAPPVPPKR